MVVKVVTRASSELVRMARESAMALRRSSTVLMTMTISLFLIMSTMCGRPSVTLLTTWNNYQRGTRRPFGVMEWPALLRKLDRIDPSYRS